MYILDVTNPEFLKWTKVQYADTVNLPDPRYIECTVYSEKLNAVFLHGGLYYNSIFTFNELYADTWKFSFATNTWTRLEEIAPPGFISGHSCTLDSSGDNVIISYGLALNDSNQALNTTWKWNLASNIWTQLTVTSPTQPINRWLLNMHLIPGYTNKFLAHHGRQPRSGNNNIYTDFWTMDLSGNSIFWKELTVTNKPPPNEVQTFAMLSDKWLLMMGGDADGNKTTADTCKPPLQCIFPVTPQDTNFFLRLMLNQDMVEWQDEAGFDHTFTRNRKASSVVMKPFVYLFGGMDWDGQHGIGEIFNTHTWGNHISNRYW
jgi:hypothetical protein